MKHKVFSKSIFPAFCPLEAQKQAAILDPQEKQEVKARIAEILELLESVPEPYDFEPMSNADLFAMVDKKCPK